MNFKFLKMHGLGNDFIVVDGISQSIPSTLLTIAFLQKLANRRFGVGFDQLLLLEPASNGVDSGIDFSYRIFNSDGSEVGQCGNGARCAHAFLNHLGLTNKRRLIFQTMTVVLETEAISPTDIRVYVPPARYDDDIHCEGYSFKCLDIGNPHAVSFAGIASKQERERIGRLMNEQCEKGINVGFAQLQDDTINLVVYERGAGQTQACGTGALAAALLAIRAGHYASSVKVKMPGGNLICGLSEAADGRCWLQGSVNFVYEGTYFDGDSKNNTKQ